jgi:hypothetical protein
MKNFYLATISLLLVTISSAAPRITAKANGNWSSATTWNMNRKPQAGDTIIIPANRIVTLNTSENLTSGFVYLQVMGTLNLSFGQLYLSNSSIVLLFADGEINSTTWIFDLIQIGGITKFWGGTTSSLDGPLLANASSGGGFMPVNLPVKFTGFDVARQGNNILLNWSTAEEANARHFEIQRSTNGSTWKTIDSVDAVGNSSSLQKYSYTDKSAAGKIVYYRLRQVDLDGRYIITTVRSIKLQEGNAEVRVYASSKNTVNVHFSEQVKSNVIIRITSMSGQVIAQHSVNRPVGQVLLQTNSDATGTYIVSITNGEELAVAKKVML